MKKYEVCITSQTYGDGRCCWIVDGDVTQEDLTFGEVQRLMYLALEEYVENGCIDKATAFDLCSSIYIFNEFMDRFHYQN